MHIISNLIAALIAWATTIEEPAETLPRNLDWADLPPHHPQCS
jgi:hypothetical protein